MLSTDDCVRPLKKIMSRGDTPLMTFLKNLATQSPTLKNILNELRIINPSPSEEEEKEVTSRNSDDETKKEEASTNVDVNEEEEKEVTSRNSDDETKKEEASTNVDVNEGKKRKSDDDEEHSANKRKKEETEDDSDDQTVEEDSLPLKIPKIDVSKQDGWMNKVYSSTDDNITKKNLRKRGEFSKEEVIFNY